MVIPMIGYVILSILGIYLFFVFTGDFIKKITKIKVCALCAAVLLTWVGLLVLKLIGYNIDVLIIGILIGQCIMGITCKLEKKMKDKFAIAMMKITMVIVGTFLAYILLQKL